MFKRPRLSATNRLVNALPWLALLFLASACSDPGQEAANPPSAPVETTTEEEQAQGLSLPAVWSTNGLDSPIANLGVAGELGSTVAVTFEDGGLQFFNFEGDLITEKAALNAHLVANGRYLMLSGVPVTLFPGTDQDGQMKIYIHGGQLPEPLAYDLDIGQTGAVAGLCTAKPEAEIDGVLRLAFWTEDAPETLISGRIVEVLDELVFLADEPVSADQPITACRLDEAAATVFSAPARAAVSLERRGRTTQLLLDTSGNYSVLEDAGITKPLTIRDGITVLAPELPVDMAGTGDARSGGYPGGILVIAGEDKNGDHRIVYIDPSDLTLGAFE
ncbi:MAG: hypothetical protein Hens3KO_02150 [Henriciella sp.]